MTLDAVHSGDPSIAPKDQNKSPPAWKPFAFTISMPPNAPPSKVSCLILSLIFSLGLYPLYDNEKLENFEISDIDLTFKKFKAWGSSILHTGNLVCFRSTVLHTYLKLVLMPALVLNYSTKKIGLSNCSYLLEQWHCVTKSAIEKSGLLIIEEKT